MPEIRSPASVPDACDVPPLELDPVTAGTRTDVRGGVDSDGDTQPDTILTEHCGELLVHTDLDGDGFADQVLGIGSDGTVRELTPGLSGTGPEPSDCGAPDDPSGTVIFVWEP